MEDLLHLTNDDLVALGVAKLAHRASLLAEIAKLHDTVSVDVSVAVPAIPKAPASPPSPSKPVAPRQQPGRSQASPAPGAVSKTVPTAPLPNAPATSPRRTIVKRFGGKFLVVSIVVHLLFGVGAAYYVVQTITAKRKLTFKGGPPSPNPSQRAIEHKVQMAKKQNTMSAPAPAKRIVTTGLSKVALPEMPTMPSANPAAKMTGMGGTGVGFGPQAGVVGTGGGGGGGIPFFGLRMEAKRIAFLLDYSGSMSGAFRKSMEKELEHCLQGLPPGTQILIIPWAGPAWLVSQKAPEIADKWKMLDGYDNYVIKSGVTLPDPTWISTNSDTVREVMKQVRAQQALPGGTDWRSPFRYVMKANPTPDVIFFMTDGQIPATHTGRAMGAINDALTKAQKVPKVNCLWIENKTPECLPDQLKKLAAKYHGDFVEVH